MKWIRERWSKPDVSHTLEGACDVSVADDGVRLEVGNDAGRIRLTFATIESLDAFVEKLRRAGVAWALMQQERDR